ncbi:MAG: nicotinate-nucleotide--dimethylbenzimidazole phosphoribosyltransferase [Coriobacteriales bacterium]|nr:nicotinate-nucleotide--dimethylbenzimidazole phosphoribosyltransferase [Coriobacteriales bacterium]
MADRTWTDEYIARIGAPDESARERAFCVWNSIAKPIGGLGELEEIVANIASISGTEAVDISKRALAVVCADNGVLVQGVSQSDYSITTAMADAITTGRASVNKMAKVANIDIHVYDMGIKDKVPGPKDLSIANGTADMSQGPAMSEVQMRDAIDKGVGIAEELVGKGYTLIATGEMGVGNTTTSSALSAVLLGMEPAITTGRGSGLGSEALRHKISVIERCIDVNEPDPADALGTLAKVGGFDIAAMVGIYLGAAINRVPVIVDGLVSSIAALVAKRAFPGCEYAMIGSHVSSEPAAKAIIAELGIKPVIDAGMHLGEGSGAVALIPLIDMALAVYGANETFDRIGIDAYEVNPE